VVDATCDYSDHVLASLDLSDVVCLVSGLDAIGVRHLSIAMQTLQRLGIPRERLRVVLNRSDSKVDLTPEDIERLLGLHVDARIPSSALVPRSVNRARLLWTDERRSDVAKGIEALADLLRAELAPEPVASSNGTSSNGGKTRRWRKG
jgi:pilus assembly protein CpaE